MSRTNDIQMPVMVSLAEAAAETGLSTFTIRQLIERRQISFFRVGVGRRGKFLINLASLVAFMERGEDFAND